MHKILLLPNKWNLDKIPEKKGAQGRITIHPLSDVVFLQDLKYIEGIINAVQQRML
jgi:hypothetical protein